MCLIVPKIYRGLFLDTVTVYSEKMKTVAYLKNGDKVTGASDHIFSVLDDE